MIQIQNKKSLFSGNMQGKSEKTNDYTCDEIQDSPNIMRRRTSQLSQQPSLKYKYSNTSSASQFCMYEDCQYQHFQVKFVKDQELFYEINSNINNVRSIVHIDHQQICMYLLQYYQWNSQKLINNYFNDNWQGFSQACSRYMQKKQELTAKVDVCNVCLQQKTLYSNGFCEHFYCKNCWSSYIKSGLHNNKIFINCMNEQPCKKSPVLKQFSDLIAPQLTDLYQKKIYNHYAILNKDVCYCPNEKCNYFFVKENMMQKQIVHCLCGQIYCFKCQKQPHCPALCSQVCQWHQLINSQQVNQSWIKNNTRKCPKCPHRIQKSMGCSHMKCSMCQTEFCYQCNSLWDQVHQKLKQKCPNTNKKQPKKQNLNKVAQLNEYLSEITNTALNHMRILAICQQNLSSDLIIKNRINKLKQDVMDAWTRLKWVKILIFLSNKSQIYQQLQISLINSISEVMKPVDFLVKNYKSLQIKDIHQYGEQVLIKQQDLKRNVNIWMNSWQEISSFRKQSFDQ